MNKKENKFQYIYEKEIFTEAYDFFFQDSNIFIGAGPCSLESEAQIFQTAEFLLSNNISYIRCFPYKIRSDPYSFQGLQTEGIPIIKKLKQKYPKLKIISEVYSQEQFHSLEGITDIFQIGTRFMYHRELIELLGKKNSPCILKRGFQATVSEWLLSSEYYLARGGRKIILCERGIRTFESSVRNSFDITSILSVREQSKIPVIIDPSHILGKTSGIEAISKAALIAGYNGLLIETHPIPLQALSDKKQQLTFEQFKLFLNFLK